MILYILILTIRLLLLFNVKSFKGRGHFNKYKHD